MFWTWKIGNSFQILRKIPHLEIVGSDYLFFAPFRTIYFFHKMWRQEFKKKKFFFPLLKVTVCSLIIRKHGQHLETTQLFLMLNNWQLHGFLFCPINLRLYGFFFMPTLGLHGFYLMPNNLGLHTCSCYFLLKNFGLSILIYICCPTTYGYMASIWCPTTWGHVASIWCPATCGYMVLFDAHTLGLYVASICFPTN
jgi:hypothetical protein